VVVNKFYLDEVYDFVIVKPTKFVSFVLFKVVDTLLIAGCTTSGCVRATAVDGLQNGNFCRSNVRSNS
jgi:NADH-quinone oxidoreductase subunit L